MRVTDKKAQRGKSPKPPADISVVSIQARALRPAMRTINFDMESGGGNMMRWKLILPAALLVAGAASAQQKVVPPKTVYWLSAATQSGFGLMGTRAPSAGDMMRMAMGGGGGPVRSLDLDLGSQLPPQGPPRAEHLIPPGMQMGESLPLRTPQPGRQARSLPPDEDFERPRGRLLLFWGCGETARAGQPVVFDFAKMAAGDIPPGLFAGERIRIARPPSSPAWQTVGRWPNSERGGSQSIPARASLVGPHKVTGTYTPDIDFSLQQDWMAPVQLRQTKLPSGALSLMWNQVPGATGHFAQLFGGSERGGDATVVFWSSSELQTFISALSDYVAPAEAARLVQRKQMLPPTQTSCAVPKEVMAAVEGGLVSFASHGPEVNIVHPPRPSDPKQPWVQQWAVKARFVSRAGAIAGMDMGDMAGASGGDERRPKCKPRAQSAGDAVAGAVLGGLIGRRRSQPQDCED